MQYEEDLLNAAFSTGYEPDDNIAGNADLGITDIRKQLLNEAEQWITNLAK